MTIARTGLFARSLAAAALSIAVAAASPATAEMHRTRHALTIRHLHAGSDVAGRYFERPVAAPVLVPLDGTGVFFQTPFSEVSTPYGPELVRVPHYQGPDGSYDDLGDLVNDIHGTPCGQACTARSLARWGYLPVE